MADAKEPQRSLRPIVALITANAISEAGNILTAVAVPWFVLQTTGSITRAGLVGVVVLLSVAVAGISGGALVDRVGYRRMSIVADLASGVTVGLIPLLHHSIGLPFWTLLVLVFLGAILDAPGGTARQSLIPDLADRGGIAIERVNATHQSVLHGINLAAPVLAGFLIAVVGESQILWIDAASFVVSAAIVAVGVPPPVKAMASTASFTVRRYATDIADGLRFIWSDSVIVGLASLSSLTAFVAGGMTGIALLAYADEVFESPEALGVIYAAAGAGLLVGTLVYGVASPRVSRRNVLLGCLIVAGLPICALAWRPGLVATVLLVGVRAVALGPIRPMTLTILLERIPAPLRGRVLGSYRTLSIVSGPAGIIVTGFCIDRVGLAPTFLGLGCIFLLAVVIVGIHPGFRSLHQAESPQD